LIVRRNGNVLYRSFVAELDQTSIARILGDGYGASELSSQFDVNLMAPGVAERFEAVCLARTSYPLAYVEALAAILVIELFRVYGTKPLPVKPPAHIGTTRFTQVVDYIEEHLDHDLSLAELASLGSLERRAIRPRIQGCVRHSTISIHHSTPHPTGENALANERSDNRFHRCERGIPQSGAASRPASPK
jgi:hypothetical protein